MPLRCLALMRRKNLLNTFLKWKPPWFKNHSLILEMVHILALCTAGRFKIFLLFVFTQRPALCSVLLLSPLLNTYFFIGKFQAFCFFFFFFLLHNFFFFFSDWERFGKVCLKQVGPFAVVACWVKLPVALQCLSGRDSDTIMPSWTLAYSRTYEWGNKNKGAECKDK